MRITDGVQNTIIPNNMPEQNEIELIRKYLKAITDRESVKDDMIRVLKQHIEILEKQIEILKKEKEYD